MSIEKLLNNCAIAGRQIEYFYRKCKKVSTKRLYILKWNPTLHNGRCYIISFMYMTEVLTCYELDS